jgi:uncharacterized protein
MSDDAVSRPPARAVAVAGVLITVLLAAVLLLWSKWLPYGARIGEIGATGSYPGSSILGVGGVRPGDAPTWGAGISFTVAYVQAVWKALVAALLISAAIQSLVPRAWLLRLLNRRSRWTGAVAGGLASTPSMMCTCCTAPVAVTLRRNGVSTAATVAYWLGNPLLNPAVLVFLVLMAPWPWTVTRVVVGILLVVGGAVLVARLTDPTADPVTTPPVPPDEPADIGPAAAPARFGRTLLRLTLVLVPEYLVVVLLIGAFRGWLFPIGGDLFGTGLVAVLVAAVVGTLLVIPTAAEIPILQGLAIAGLAAGPIGALLVTLPAVSLPGVVMVSRAFGWRATAVTAAVVAAGGVAGAALLTVL